MIYYLKHYNTKYCQLRLNSTKSSVFKVKKTLQIFHDCSVQVRVGRIHRVHGNMRQQRQQDQQTGLHRGRVEAGGRLVLRRCAIPES